MDLITAFRTERPQNTYKEKSVDTLNNYTIPFAASNINKEYFFKKKQLKFHHPLFKSFLKVFQNIFL